MAGKDNLSDLMNQARDIQEKIRQATIKDWVNKHVKGHTLDWVQGTENLYTIYAINPPIKGISYVCRHSVTAPISDTRTGCRSSRIEIEEYFDADGKHMGHVFTDEPSLIEYPKNHVLLTVWVKTEKHYKRGEPKNAIFPADCDLVKFIKPKKPYIMEITQGKYRVNERYGNKLVAHIFDDSGKEVDKYDVNIYKPDKFKSAQKKVVAKGKTSRVIKPAEKEY